MKKEAVADRLSRIEYSYQQAKLHSQELSLEPTLRDSLLIYYLWVHNPCTEDIATVTGLSPRSVNQIIDHIMTDHHQEALYTCLENLLNSKATGSPRNILTPEDLILRRQKVMVLRENDVSLSQIAKQLNISIGTVKNDINRSKSQPST